MATIQEQNKARVREYISEIINKHVSGRFSEYVPEDGIDHSAPPGMPAGSLGTEMFFKMFYEASSDMHNTILSMAAEEDKVSFVSQVSGTHDGVLMGMPPTGKKFSVTMLETVRIVDGKYAEHWGGMDLYSMMIQLGALKDPNLKSLQAKYPAIVQRYIDGVNNHDEAALREAFAVDFVDHNNAQVQGLPQGVEGVVMAHNMLHESFNDITFTIDDYSIEDDKIGIRVHAEGTHTGPFYGFPPSGKKIQWTAHRIIRIANGQMVEAWNEFDQVGILQQMGVIPSFATPPNPEANKALVRRLYDEENKGNVDIIDELMSPDFVMHGDALNPYQKGLEPLKAGVVMTKAAFPDLVVTIEDILAAGDKVMVRLRWTGTNSVPFMGLPASGKQMSWTAIATNRIENGKIVERWFNSDVFSMLQQLGMIPS